MQADEYREILNQHQNQLKELKNPKNLVRVSFIEEFEEPSKDKRFPSPVKKEKVISFKMKRSTLEKIQEKINTSKSKLNQLSLGFLKHHYYFNYKIRFINANACPPPFEKTKGNPK